MPGSSADIDKCGNIITSFDDPIFPLKNSIRPNPSTSGFNIMLEGNYEYVIHDISAREVEAGNGHGVKQVGSDLPKGVYLLLVKKEGVVENIRVIKN